MKNNFMVVMLLNIVLFVGYYWIIEIEIVIMWYILFNDIGIK